MRLPCWKKSQKKRQAKKTSRLIRRTLFLIGLVVILGVIYQIWGSFQDCLWDGRNRLTFVINSEPILVVSLNPLNKTLALLSLPGKTYIEAIGGYGFYKAESLWELGKLENWGGELLAGSLQEYLGAPVDAYASNLEFGWQKDRAKESCLDLIMSLILGRGVTDLTKWDLIRLWWGVNQIRFDKVNLIELEETEAVEEIILADGTEALESDPLYLDRLVGQLLIDQAIRGEDFSIGVFNAAGQPGLAKGAARLVNNFGGRVIKVSDWASEKDDCEIIGKEKLRRSYSVRKLSQIFDCQYDSKEGDEQVELSLILGRNYWQRLMGK